MLLFFSAAGAGTAADLDQVCEMISANLKLHELNTGRKARIIAGLRVAKQHLFKYKLMKLEVYSFKNKLLFLKLLFLGTWGTLERI